MPIDRITLENIAIGLFIFWMLVDIGIKSGNAWNINRNWNRAEKKLVSVVNNKLQQQETRIVVHAKTADEEYTDAMNTYLGENSNGKKQKVIKVIKQVKKVGQIAQKKEKESQESSLRSF